MTFLRRLFNRPFRLARAAEGAGDYRRAAALYAEAEAPEEAANALLFHAARAGRLEDRLEAYHDALRWLPPGHPRRPEVQAHIGLAVLEDAQRRGATTAEEKDRLEDAAERLERAARFADAATAWELLGRTDAVARCLERSGDIERLESLLEKNQAAEAQERRLRRLVKDYEMSMKVGARVEARQALREAVEAAPDDTAVADLLRRLGGRWLAPSKVELERAGQRLFVVGRLPVTLGRDADVVIRGASVSRTHCEIALEDGSLVVRDLGSRNGTLVRGVPMGRQVRLSGETVLGLGDDVAVRVTPRGECALVEVTRGLDRGLVALVGEGELRLPEVSAKVAFPAGHATLAADEGTELVLGTQRCALPIVLLRDDVVSVGPHRLEVCG